MGSATEPYVDETVVVNEAFADREIARILSKGDPTGAPAMAHWFKLMRQVQPHASLWLNEASLSDNNGRDTERQDYYYNLAKSLIQQGAPLDGIADQAHFSAPTEPEKLLAMWNRFGSLGKKLQVTEYDCKMGDPQLEADWTRDVVTLAFSQPQMTGFTMWGILDQAHWLNYAPLYTAKAGGYELKPSGKAYLDLVHGAWWTRAQKPTGADGTLSLRGIKGDYRVSVLKDGRAQIVFASIGDKPSEAVLHLTGEPMPLDTHDWTFKVAQNGSDVGRAFDGDARTLWETHAKPGEGQWLIMQAPKPVEASRVEVHFAPNSKPNGRFLLRASNAGEDDQDLLSGQVADFLHGDVLSIPLPQKTTKSQWKLVQLGAQRDKGDQSEVVWRVSEINVF